MFQNKQKEFIGHGKVPELFKQFDVTKCSDLRRKLSIKYPFLNKIIHRNPTTPLYPNRNRLESLIYKINSESTFKFFPTWIDTEIDYIKARLLVVMYGLSEFGNVVRIEYDHKKPYFFTSFPFHLFDDSYVYFLKNNLHEFDLTHFKNVINEQIKLSLDEKARKKYSRFCQTYNYPDESYIVDLSIEWHIEGIGNNLDTPKPFLKFTCLMPEIMTKISWLLKQTRSDFHYQYVPKSEYDEENDLYRTRKLTLKQYKKVAKKNKPLLERSVEKKKIIYIAYEKAVFYDNAPLSWIHQINVDHQQDNRFKFEKPWEQWETDSPFYINFLKDLKLKSSEWWDIKNVFNFTATPYMFNVDLTLECSGDDIKAVADDDPIKKKFPDDVIFLFDGEMIGKAGHFPSARDGDPIGQLGVHIIRTEALLNRYSLKEALEKNLFYSLILTALPVKSFTSVFNDENNKYNVKVLNYVRQGNDEDNNNQMEEFQMLKEFCELITFANPSFCFAYNGNRFDWPYIIDRMWMLHNDTDKYDRPKFDWNINDYIYVTRDFRSNKGIFHDKAKAVGSAQLAKASARVSYDKVKITGISNLDLYLYVKQFAKYGMKSSYSLDAASMKYLKEKKIEINYDFIPILFQKQSGRLSIAKYCNRDVELMTRLINVLGAMEFIYFIGQIAIIPPQDMVDRGTQFLVDGIWYTSSVVYDHLTLYNNQNPEMKEYFEKRHQKYKERHFKDQKVNCNFLLPHGFFYLKDLEGPLSKGEDEKGGGADVIEAPTTKTTDTQTLDFASLYPSIMMTFNICPTTLLWFKNRLQIITKIKRLRDRFRIAKNEAMFKRKESWFCTGDKSESFVSLDDAMKFLNSDSCNYPENMKKTMKKIAKKLFSSPENLELIKKYEPLVMNQYDKIDPSNFTDHDKKDETMEEIYINIIEPICQLTGKTKVQYKNKLLPIFLGKGFRQGVFPWREQQLFKMRAEIKAEMNAAADEIERLLREGVPKTDPRIKKLEAKRKECDVKQQAVKCAMNSMYGWLASKLLAKLSLQETVCVIGQFLLQDTKCFIDSGCKKAMGFIGDYITTSGDTDSDFSKAQNIDHQKVREAFLIQIQKDYSKRNAEQFNQNEFNKMSSFVNQVIKESVDSGKLLDKNASKASFLFQWKIILDDVFYRKNQINPLRLDLINNESLSKEIIDMIGFLKSWFDKLFVQNKVYFENLSESEWSNIKFSPDPPLFTKIGDITTVTPQNFRMLIRWLHINMLFESGRRTERVINRIFKTKYNGVIKQELEKVYEYIIWWRKKKYAGCVWMPGASAPSIKATGIASVRGDCFPFKSKLCEDIVYLLLEENDNEAAKEHGYKMLKKIMDGKVSVHEFIQSKNIKKDLMEYGKKEKITKKISIGGKDHYEKVDKYPSSMIRIQENMPVHVKNAIRIYLRHKEPLPQIDDRYHFIVMANYGTKSVQISERGIPPLAILKSDGIIQYDKTYYAECCVKQLSSLLEPIFDTRTFEEKMLQAEVYRRIQDKSIRNEMIEKFSKKQRDIIAKHYTNYIKQGVKMKDQNHFRNTTPNLGKTKCNDIRNFFAGCSSDTVITPRASTKRAIIDISNSQEEEKTKDNEEPKPCSMDEIVENLDAYASNMPYKFSEFFDPQDDDLNDDEDNNNKKDEITKCILCGHDKRTNIPCGNCKANYVNNDDQTNILHYFQKSDIKCIFCNKKGKSSVCDECIENDGEKQLHDLKSTILDKQLNSDCSRCAKCFGVDAPKLSDEQKEQGSALDLKDIEDIINNFYEENQPVKYCTAITCANRWNRMQNTRRMDILGKVEFDFDKNKKSKSLISYEDDDTKQDQESNKKLRIE